MPSLKKEGSHLGAPATFSWYLKRGCTFLLQLTYKQRKSYVFCLFVLFGVAYFILLLSPKTLVCLRFEDHFLALWSFGCISDNKLLLLLLLLLLLFLLFCFVFLFCRDFFGKLQFAQSFTFQKSEMCSRKSSLPVLQMFAK